MFKKLREKRSAKLQIEQKRGDVGTLERKTAEIKEKLSRLSFGSILKPHHSAPAAASGSHDVGDRSISDEIRRRDSNPAQPTVLEELPTPILELILERIAFKVNCFTAHACHFVRKKVNDPTGNVSLFSISAP